MIVNGIIAEYNPFHNGHKYQLFDAKQNTHADKTVIVMSGNFVQRGEPAFIDKFVRTKMALLNGADLVLELSPYASTSSAEEFAYSSVKLLDGLNIITNLCFGSETSAIKDLETISNVLSSEPEEYTTLLRTELRKGLSFPLARSNALASLYPELNIELLSGSNNILGIEYLKAISRLNAKLNPFITTRTGKSYNDVSIDNDFASALGIRNHFKSKAPMDNVKSSIPDNLWTIYDEEIAHNNYIFDDSISSFLRYKIYSEADFGFERYMDVTKDLSDRIINNMYCFETFTQFAELVKTKNLTLSHVKRALLHIVLGMTKDGLDFYKEKAKPYAKILGFNRQSTDLLSEIKKNSTIPIISKYADYKQYLDSDSAKQFEEDIRINRIYQSLFSTKSKSKAEYSSPIIIV